ncbi:MAG: hypothetical protein Ct9H300mP1_14980 [Planctomycetaceae bacterium]|nr:MAG: hypothetical protein Ct9H300mP1_14980 [Planctomycetaceae bacterium]
MFETTGCDGSRSAAGFGQPLDLSPTGSMGTDRHWDPPGSFDDRMSLLLEQFEYLVEQKGEPKAIVSFRKMIHWYLKSMRVRRPCGTPFSR